MPVVPRWLCPLAALAALSVACGSGNEIRGESRPTLGAVTASTVSSPGADDGLPPAPTSTATTGPAPTPPTPATDSGADDAAAPGSAEGSPPTSPSAPPSPPAVADESAGPPPAAGEDTITIRLRLDRRVDDAGTEGFEALVERVLTDDRGWARAGFEFAFDDENHDYTVVLAEGSDVDELCLPYDTFGRFSCQIGPVVALNADRWRNAVDDWPASLDVYRTMLVNHEVGHLLGQHHPAARCPGAGEPAPVMAQQSSGVAPCTANPWPLDWEITCASQRVEPLAPPYERDIELTCGPEVS